MARTNPKSTKNSPAVSQGNAEKAHAAKPKPRSSGTFKPGGELSATIK